MTSQPATAFRVAWTSWAGAIGRECPSVALHPIGTRISGAKRGMTLHPSYYADPLRTSRVHSAKFFVIGASGGKRRPWVKNKNELEPPLQPSARRRLARCGGVPAQLYGAGDRRGSRLRTRCFCPCSPAADQAFAYGLAALGCRAPQWPSSASDGALGREIARQHWPRFGASRNSAKPLPIRSRPAWTVCITDWIKVSSRRAP